ncbi:MAG TPA: hypothetical protein VHK88_10995 [Aquihabitans sp.]|nr:hypothetical protein [Aquihabitans sp.]
MTAATSCSSRTACRAAAPGQLAGRRTIPVLALVGEAERIWRRGAAGRVLVLVSSASLVLWVTAVVAGLALVLGR